VTTNKPMHMIGNAHLDPVWLWQWQEGFQEAKATFRSALDRLAEYDDFVFTSSSAVMYEWIERNEPAMFEEIRSRVAEGRWVLCGGWWLQPDCNLPSGESFVRQGLYGQRYFREKLGATATVGYNPDSFGHHGMLPQILKKSGMDHYVFMRPQPHEKTLPSRLFRWRSDDGSEVLAFRIPFEYTRWGKQLDEHVEKCAGELPNAFGHVMCFYGVGNHGGGPTKENLESIRALSGRDGLPELTMSDPVRYFAEVDPSWPLPVVHDELQMHAVGCYSVHSGIKRWNREGENRLLVAEKFASVARDVAGQPYPTDFGAAWKHVLFNQFHDILAGTSIEPAYDDARDMHGYAMTIAATGLNYALQALAWRIDIPAEDGMVPIVAFNPNAWPVRANVELQFGHPGLVGKSFLRGDEVLLDDEGRRVPMQVVQSLATTRFRQRIGFMADLPALGYRVYRVVADAAAPALPPAAEAVGTTIENERYRLTIDPATGWIASLYDKAAGVEAFAGPAAKPVVVHDPSDTWGHNMTRYDEEIGVFTATSVKLAEHGPVKSVLRVTSAYGRSTLTQDFILRPGYDPIEVAVKVDWRETFKLLKLRFPVNVVRPTATYEIPYGHIVREPDGDEEPGQSWIDVGGLAFAAGDAADGGSNASDGVVYGVSLLNDGKYAFDVAGATMSMTVLRSPIYAHHIPGPIEEDKDYSFIDQGEQRFTYALLPHRGTWKEAGTVRRAAELNQRPIPLMETYHAGPLPQRGSFIAVSHDALVVSAIKQAEDGGDLIVRCYEAHGEPASGAEIALPHLGRVIRADFGPCEIKTFRIPLEKDAPIVETNLIED